MAKAGNVRNNTARRQAIQIGLLPFMRIVHTSGEKEGQIYLPAINRAMGVGCILAVLIFMTPEHLAAAYGVAVTTVMTTTTILLAVVAKKVWKPRNIKRFYSTFEITTTTVEKVKETIPLEEQEVRVLSFPFSNLFRSNLIFESFKPDF